MISLHKEPIKKRLLDHLKRPIHFAGQYLPAIVSACVPRPALVVRAVHFLVPLLTAAPTVVVPRASTLGFAMACALAVANTARPRR